MSPLATKGRAQLQLLVQRNRDAIGFAGLRTTEVEARRRPIGRWHGAPPIDM